jgi:endonuclease-3
MPATTNKQRTLSQLLSMSGKNSEARSAEELPVLEQFIYGLCREGTTRRQADEFFQTLRDRFFDWNEVRVSSVREVEEVFGDLPDAEVRAQRLIAFLQEVFETTFSFDLEGLHKKGLKQAAKQLARYQAANDYVVAWVIQQCLGGHAIPLDAPSLRVVHRLGLIDGDAENPEAARSSLEHHIPKARGTQFINTISNVASEWCGEHDPNCASCPLAAECPTGQENGAGSIPTGRAGRVKPR